MNARKFIIILLLLVGTLTMQAQSFTLSGKVIDQDGNAIELCTIACLEQGVVRMTDLKGEYKMTLHSADSVVIRFSMVGYQTKTRVLRRPRGNQKLQVTLPPMQSLQEVPAHTLNDGQCRRRTGTATGGRVNPQRDVVAIQCPWRFLRRELRLYQQRGGVSSAAHS